MNTFRTGLLVLTAIVLVCVSCAGGMSPAGDGPRSAPQPIPSGPPPEPTRSWSDATAWPGGLPAEGQTVTILPGETVLLDVNPPSLGALIIDGTLIFAAQNLELTADSILVQGALFIGSSDEPFTDRAVITLTGEQGLETDNHMGDRFLATTGTGRIEIHGLQQPGWSRLTRDALAGANSIMVADATGWQVGDLLVIATTDFEMWVADDYELQTEERTVTGINGNSLNLDAPLEYFHVGEIMTIAGVKVDQRAEVARLTRNIVIQGPAGTLDDSSPDYGFGGHVMVMPGGSGRFTGVEFRRMGQRGLLARYPVHYHLLRDGGAGSYVRHSAVHQSFSRCVTIHGSNHVLVQDVVGYGAMGHCFFLEDGAELGNMLYGNLALATRRPTTEFAILESDRNNLGPAGFWITHPDNELVGNHAVGSPGTGFWYALPERPTGLYYDVFGAQGITPRSAQLGKFRDNTAHSNRSTGLHVDNGPSNDLKHTPPTWYAPRSNPDDADSAPVAAVFEGFNAWRNRDAGAWFRGDNAVLRGGILSDNAIGVTFASDASLAENVKFIGETDNLGSPRGWESTGAGGRSLPRPWDADFAIRGFEFYDGDVAIVNSFFAAYEPDSLRQAAALSYKNYTAFSVSPLNSAAGLTFASGTSRVSLETRVPTEEFPADGYRSAIFVDEDGSVTGTKGAAVTTSNSFLLAGGCSKREDWNAWVCPPDNTYASLTLQAIDTGARSLGNVTISRQDGEQHMMMGVPGTSSYRTLLLLGDDYTYQYSGKPAHLRLNLRDIVPGTSLHVSLPYTGGTPAIYRDWWIDRRSLLPAHSSVAALLASGQSGYFHDGTRLHVNLLQQGERDYAQVEICLNTGC